MHTFKQDYARNDPGTETKPTVQKLLSEVTPRRITCIIICAKGGDLPLDDEVCKTLVIL